jgi:polyhydroxyalkanoate synthesis regulator phasin
MKDVLRKAWLFGVGMYEYSKEKVEDLVEEMVRRGEITQQEGPEAVRQLWEKAQDAQQALWEKVKELTRNAVDELNLAKASELEALEKRVTALESAFKAKEPGN